jgi:Plasmid pRiA4b ORF-3-like protein
MITTPPVSGEPGQAPFQLRILLREVRPPVWRRVLVPGEMTLVELHEVVQTVMGWSNSHLHEFDVDGARYGVPDSDWGLDEVADESRVKLFRVAREGGRLRYAYDFGDGWQHDLTVEKVLARQPGTRYPRCIGGRRACPPEDVGGPWGYQDFLAAVADPGHDEHEQWVEWIGGGFDPAEFDLAAADKALDAFAWADSPIRPARDQH